MSHKGISSPDAPGAIGPYNPAVVHAKLGLVFASGQIPLDPATGELVSGTIAEETGRVLTNLRALLEAVGSGMDRVLKTTVFLTSMDDFAEMNQTYAEYFPGVKPARSAVEVSRLPKDVRVEIEAIATL
jgi:2-iminobutanoate/2-iminopropanoate deaminase